MSDHENPETEEPVLLPDREVMSLITPPIGEYTGVPDLGDPAAPAEDAATGAATGSDAEASTSGEESSTQEDRHDQISASDSATATT